MSRMPNAINMDPWQINQQGLQDQQRRNVRQEQRNDQLVDQITEPMRRYSNTMAESQAQLDSSNMFREQGFDVSSGRPSTRRSQPRFQSPQVGDQDFFDTFMSTVQGNGVTNPYALAAIAATGQAESGWSRVHDEWDDPSESGQQGRSGLSMSWRAERLQAAREFARSVGDNPNAPSAQTQAAFFLNEDPELIQRLNNAGSQQEAINLMRDAWRYADPQGGQTRARLEMANHFLPKFGGRAHSRSQLDKMGAGPQEGEQFAEGERVTHTTVDNDGNPVEGEYTRTWMSPLDIKRIRDTDLNLIRGWEFDGQVRRDGNNTLLSVLIPSDNVAGGITDLSINVDAEDDDEDFVRSLAGEL